MIQERIKYTSPLFLGGLAAVLWTVMYIIAPVEVNTENLELSLKPIAVLVSCSLGYFGGIYVARFVKIKDSENCSSSSFLLKYCDTILLMLGVVGVLTQLMDKFILRGISLNNPSLVNREILIINGPTFLSVAAAVLFPFSLMMPWVLMMVSKNKWVKLACIIIYILALVPFVALGSRSGIFIFGVNLFAYFFLFNKNAKKVIIAGLVLLPFLSFLSTKHFVSRTRQEKPAPIHHIVNHAGINFTVKADEKTRESIEDEENETLQIIKLSRLTITQYYVHGVFEFSYLVNSPDIEYQFGKLTFNPFYKFFRKLQGKPNIDFMEVYPRPGVYTSVLGAIYLDFGYFSFLFVFLFGFLQYLVYRNTKNGKIEYLPLHIYFCVITIFAPVFNFISGAQGMYIITTLVLFIFAYRMISKRSIPTKSDS